MNDIKEAKRSDILTDKEIAESTSLIKKVKKSYEKESEALTKEELEDFIDYCFNYYGENGRFDIKATKEQIREATNIYLDKNHEDSKLDSLSFDADTVDRENVREILIKHFKLEKREAHINEGFWVGSKY